MMGIATLSPSYGLKKLSIGYRFQGHPLQEILSEKRYGIAIIVSGCNQL